MALFRVFRTHPMFDAQHIKQIRDSIRQSREVAGSSTVDGFAGRKTQGQFPSEEESMDSANINPEAATGGRPDK